MSAFRIAGCALAVSMWCQTPAGAWSLKTHAWIAQEVLNDVLPDGRLTIAGREYDVPVHVLNALRSHPDQYRMGHLGPDVFPDPVVGQVTTHPGLIGGWQTDDWLKHLLRNARSSEEIAFAYGFAGHAAGDVFAHSYVNIYSGDIFELKGEREVERRHFVLEKYIESRTPSPRLVNGSSLDLRTAFGTPTPFLRDKLILNNGASGQNARATFGLHLTAMNEVKNSVALLDTETQKVISSLTGFGADYLKKHAEIAVRFATAKDALKAAEEALKAQQKILELKRQAYEMAISAAESAQAIIRDNPGLLNIQAQILAEQAKVLLDATVYATEVAAKVNEEVENLRRRISDLRGDIVGFACNVLVWPPAVKKCRQEVDRLNDSISRLEGEISGAHARQAVAEKARDVAKANHDGTLRLIDRLRDDYNKAMADVASGALQAAIEAARLQMEAEERLLQAAQRTVLEAQKIQERIEKELMSATVIVDEIKKLLDRYNLVTLLLAKWQADINVAAEEYIKASHRTGIKMLLNEGSPIDEYREWFSCYGQVFLAQPREIGQAGCLVKNFLADLRDQYNSLIDRLPEFLRWIINPTRELEKQVRVKLEPELAKAGIQILGFLTDPTTADFLSLLSSPENATRAKLNDVYQVDKSQKNLLTFDAVADLIDNDFPTKDGSPNPYQFAALTHSVTLAKLALLGPAGLNDVIRTYVGSYVSPRYGATVYSSSDLNFTLLFDVVRSIDGNHQWQAYGLPWPKRTQAHAKPAALPYGHNHRDDPTKGLRFWIDPYLRERVFLALFPNQIVGAVGARAEMKLERYKFPSCPAHPFPVSQNASGAPVEEDRTCSSLTTPQAPASQSWASVEEYRSRFFLCEEPLAGERHWTIIASLTSQGAAERHAASIRKGHPDLHIEVWEPAGRNSYWPVIVSACADRDRAYEARDVIIRRGIAPDTFVWRTSVPWRPLNKVAN